MSAPLPLTYAGPLPRHPSRLATTAFVWSILTSPLLTAYPLLWFTSNVLDRSHFFCCNCSPAGYATFVAVPLIGAALAIRPLATFRTSPLTTRSLLFAASAVALSLASAFLGLLFIQALKA